MRPAAKTNSPSWWSPPHRWSRRWCWWRWATTGGWSESPAPEEEQMKINRLEILRADAGWRSFSFLKVMTDAGITGWSEYAAGPGSAGLTQVIEAIAPMVI